MNVLYLHSSWPLSSCVARHACCARATSFASFSTSSSSSPYIKISETMADLAAWIWKFRTEKPSLGSISRKVDPAAVCCKNSSGAMAPFSLEQLRSPPALTTVIPRKHLGVFLKFRRLAMKNACCMWLLGCRPWNQGNTCDGSGKGWPAM